eukprot:87281-Rhodomonas_salina.2
MHYMTVSSTRYAYRGHAVRRLGLYRGSHRKALGGYLVHVHNLHPLPHPPLQHNHPLPRFQHPCSPHTRGQYRVCCSTYAALVPEASCEGSYLQQPPAEAKRGPASPRSTRSPTERIRYVSTAPGSKRVGRYGT